MKKRLPILMVCMLLLTCFGMPVHGMLDVQIPLKSYDGTESVSLASPTVLTITNNVAEADRVDDPVYQISGTATKKLGITTGENYITAASTIQKTYKKLRISMDVKIADGKTGISIRSRNYSDSACGTSGTPVSLMDIPATALGSGWNTVALDLNADGTSEAYTVWLNDEVYKSGTTTAGYGLSFARIQPTCANGTKVNIYLDNIVVSYEISVPEVVSVNEGSEVNYDAESFTVQLDGTLGEVLPSDIVLRSGDEETPVAAVEVQENALLVTPQTALVSGSAYTLTLQPTAKLADGTAISQAQTVNFFTTSQDLDIIDGTLSQGTTVTFSGTYVDTTEGTSAKAVLVFYDADGRIDHVTFEDIAEGQFTLTEENPNGYTVKAFCVADDFQQVIGDKIF